MMFDAMVQRHNERMAVLEALATLAGGLIGTDTRHPGHRLLLSRSVSGDCAWRVTSFCDGQPVGHRDYDRLIGGGPCQNALQEFADETIEVRPAMVPVHKED
jgi:hypothetical protein